MKKIFTILLVSLFLFAGWASAQDFVVATGKPTLSYHNFQFDQFTAAVKRLSGDSHTVNYFDKEKGTDGSKQNMKLVNAGDKANVGFVQYGATVIEKSDKVTAFGPIAWEVANFVHKKGSKFESCSDMENAGARVGLNTESGSAVTWGVYGTVDKDYLKTTIVDTTRGSIALSKLKKGEIDGYFWVSTPGTEDHARFLADPSVEFGDCRDGDFEDFRVFDTVLYPEYTFDKKLAEQLGYGKVKIKTHLVPAYIIVNNDLLAKDERLYDLFTDVAGKMYAANKAKGKNMDWYPNN